MVFCSVHSCVYIHISTCIFLFRSPKLYAFFTFLLGICCDINSSTIGQIWELLFGLYWIQFFFVALIVVRVMYVVLKKLTIVMYWFFLLFQLRSIVFLPSLHTEGDNGMSQPRNTDSVGVTCSQKCCIGGQSQSARRYLSVVFIVQRVHMSD